MSEKFGEEESDEAKNAADRSATMSVAQARILAFC